MSAALSTLMVRSIALTPKADKEGVSIKLKVFWKTVRFWTEADIADFQKSVKPIAERLRTEQYWNKDGDIRSNRFTCEDFAIRVLCEYASSKGLPVKLTTGVRTYRNMEIYSAEHHDRYASNIYGFSEMVMLTYGAPDMQRKGANTILVSEPEELVPGDVLAQANDLQGKALAVKRDSAVNVAHHIQLTISTSDKEIEIFQGNSNNTIHFITPKLMKIFGRNPADPQDRLYAGLPIERGKYSKNKIGKWDYENLTSKRRYDDKLSEFMFYRWNFHEFNQ
ncbi:hypothetical protein SAMN06265795_11596 [Noviherbaspirillum humi]|uniref:Uncharacterized protein n=1 Tax=Noviherbaspirillum humi TaxID=1688639 RepID=A0A239KCB8_9BURK|nr:hypothetical protein [Noviherbaspirillum humi]SNT15731.1 hypothetical protein SAMN06265795_11596 [Noviherbaspirillum humi]